MLTGTLNDARKHDLVEGELGTVYGHAAIKKMKITIIGEITIIIIINTGSSFFFSAFSCSFVDSACLLLWFYYYCFCFHYFYYYYSFLQCYYYYCSRYYCYVDWRWFRSCYNDHCWYYGIQCMLQTVKNLRHFLRHILKE